MTLQLLSPDIPIDGGADPYGGVVRPLLVKPTITIDGPSACGKSTLGVSLARHYQVPLIDTGAYYRVLGLRAIEAGIDLQKMESDPDLERAVVELARGIELSFGEAKEKGQQIYSEGLEISEKLHNNTVSDASSRVARVQQAREIINEKIRELAKTGAVMVGRDCGTEILPDALVKVYLFATPEERAKRRLHQYEGIPIDQIDTESQAFKDQMDYLKQRDERDSQRASSPLRKPEGSLEIDTTPGEPEVVFGRVVVYADSAMHDIENDL